MSDPRWAEHTAPLSHMNAATAPLGAVLLAVIALWIIAIPAPLHAVSLDLRAGCAGVVESTPVVHAVTIGAEGVVTWDGEVLAGRAALEARMRAVGAMPLADQPEVRVTPHASAGYGAFAAVMAAAQRNGVRRMGMAAQGEEFVLAVAASCSPVE